MRRTMDDYISREAALELLDGIYDCNDMVFRDNDSCVGSDCKSCRWRDTRNYIRDRLARIPAADVEPVRHGWWKPFDLTWGRSVYACTACEEAFEIPTVMGKPIYAYCPNCGALMEKDGD